MRLDSEGNTWQSHQYALMMNTDSKPHIKGKACSAVQIHPDLKHKDQMFIPGVGKEPNY